MEGQAAAWKHAISEPGNPQDWVVGLAPMPVGLLMLPAPSSLLVLGRKPLPEEIQQQTLLEGTEFASPVVGSVVLGLRIEVAGWLPTPLLSWLPVACNVLSRGTGAPASSFRTARILYTNYTRQTSQGFFRKTHGKKHIGKTLGMGF